MSGFEVVVTYTDQEIRFQFPYDQVLNDALKRTFRELGYRWDKGGRFWAVPTGAVAQRVAQDWVDGLRKLGVPLREADLRTRGHPPAALAPEEEQVYRAQRATLDRALSDVSIWERLRRFDQEGRRRYGTLWDQD